MKLLTITSKFHEVSSGYRGPNEPSWGYRSGHYYRYHINDEHKTSGSFSVNLLEEYRKIYTILDPHKLTCQNSNQ